MFTRGAPDDPNASDSTNVAVWNSGVTRQKLQFSYDYLGRRASKVLSNRDSGNTAWVPALNLRFLYDGWNLLDEFDAAASLAKVRAHVWGLDISGTLQGAGGVGGLLYTYDYASGNSYLPAYDALGNIHGMIKASDGSLAAAYEYDAFGNTLRESGAYAASNPFRFATKYADLETGLVQYNTRYYSPSLGRFLNRDTISEQGGLNLYAYCSNNGVNHWDYLGNIVLAGSIAEFKSGADDAIDAALNVQAGIAYVKRFASIDGQISGLGQLEGAIGAGLLNIAAGLSKLDSDSGPQSGPLIDLTIGSNSGSGGGTSRGASNEPMFTVPKVVPKKPVFTVGSVDTTQGLLATLLLTELNVKGKITDQNLAMYENEMNAIMSEINNRMGPPPKGYSARDYSGASTVLGVVTSTQNGQQYAGFSLDANGKVVVAQSTLNNLNSILTAANQGAQGNYAALVTYANSIAANPSQATDPFPAPIYGHNTGASMGPNWVDIGDIGGNHFYTLKPR